MDISSPGRTILKSSEILSLIFIFILVLNYPRKMVELYIYSYSSSVLTILSSDIKKLLKMNLFLSQIT